MAPGTLKVGRWSRKAGGRCIRCSSCVDLFVHGKTVRWSLKPVFTVGMIKESNQSENNRAKTPLVI